MEEEPTIAIVACSLDESDLQDRRCCAFAEWSVDTRADTLVLDVTADNTEVIAAVHAMFDQLRSE